MNKSITFRIFAFVLVVALGAGAAGCGPSSSTDWYVSLGGNDANDCKSAATPCQHIATAIQRASSGNTIHVGAGTYSENLSLTKSLTILGAGSNQSIIDGSNGAASLTSTLIIDGSAVSGGLTVNLEDLAIKNGSANAGGGIHASNVAFLLLKGVLVSENTWVSSGLPDQYGAGIYFYGESGVGGSSHKLNLLNSTVQDNNGDGIALFGNGDLDIDGSLIHQNDGTGVIYGGDNTTRIFMTTLSSNQNGALMIAYAEDQVTVDHSIIDGNQGGYSGAIYNQGDLTLMNSTISNNTGGAGGGILNKYRLIAKNDTFSGNSVTPYMYAYYPDNGSGGAIYNYTDPANVGWFDAMNLTIANNSAAVKGGGIYTSGNMPSIIQDTLVVKNTGGDCYFDTAPSSAITDISTDSSCPGFTVVADPMIAPLADNGGGTQTHALFPGSPAIDAGTGGGGAPATDQRGTARPKDGNADGTGANDIGAYEFDPGAPYPAPAMVSGVVWKDVCALAPDTSPVPNPLPAGCIQDSYGIDADAIRQPGEAGIPGVTVSIASGDCPLGMPVAQVATDANGAYQLPALPAGKYCLNVNAAQFAGPSATGHWTLVPSGHEGNSYRVLTLAAGQVLTGQDFGWYEPPVSIGGIEPIGPKIKLKINANCHVGPGLDYDSVAVGVNGQAYPIEGISADYLWYYVNFDGTLRCWFGKGAGETSGDLSQLPPGPEPAKLPVACSSYATRSACAADATCRWVIDARVPYCTNK